MVSHTPLEQTIIELLMGAPQQELSAEKLLNEVVERTGSTQNPLKLEDYQRALGSLVDQQTIQKTRITIDGYEPCSTQMKTGYRLS